MNVAQIISAKRDGNELTEEQIGFLISGFASGEIPDYQMSALAMAVYFQGMTIEETTSLTREMLNSGETISWPGGKPKVDKHSTGGIGDKVSIPLAPILACCDVEVPMISGRGLGATGGTLDKLESIPGYRCDLSIDEFKNVVNWNGCSITGATGNLAPADQKLYALRDVTGTVPSIPLITASILSKKLAEGISSLVLDVKWGSGAFMKTIESARELAKSLVAVGNRFDVNTVAVITDMNQPLGNMIGNGVEVDESVDLLRGEGPADVTELTIHLAAQLLVNAGVQPDMDAARKKIDGVIQRGEALAKLSEMIQNHSGDLDATRERGTEHLVKAYDEGFVSRIDAERLGLAVIEMGGGRKLMTDSLDHTAGIEFLVRIGQRIEKGETIAKIFCNDKSKADYAANLVSLAIGTSPLEVPPAKLIVETISR